MPITPVFNNTQFKNIQQIKPTVNGKKKPNYVKITGYGALMSGLLCGTFAKKRKVHKCFAFCALISSLAHIGILESYKFKKHG